MSKERAQDLQQSDNTCMLEAILENAQMGELTLNQLIPMAEEGLFKAELLRQRKVYHEIADKAELSLTAAGETPRGQSAWGEMNTRMGVAMKTMGDKSTRNLAEMLAQGSQKGVVDCCKCRSDFANAAPGTRNMLKELEDFQTDSCTRLQQFL